MHSRAHAVSVPVVPARIFSLAVQTDLGIVAKFLVRMGRLELPRPYERWNLNPEATKSLLVTGGQVIDLIEARKPRKDLRGQQNHCK